MRSKEDTQKYFDNRFNQWAERFQPNGDTSALRAIAWYWFAYGRDETVGEVMGSLHTFANKEIYEGFTTDERAFPYRG